MTNLFRLLTAGCSSFILVLTLSCSNIPHQISSGHLESPTPVPDGVPHLVTGSPIVPVPKAAAAEETYSVVVTNVPVDEMLFALTRDAHINVDVHPGLSGTVTLNAIDQTLTQILERIAAQIDIRYHFENDLLVVEPDQAYLHTYRVDYVNLVRTSRGQNSVATQITTSGAIAGAEGGDSGSSGNSSITSVDNKTENSFWSSLEANINAMLDKKIEAGEEQSSNDVIINRETSLLTARATHRQHRQIQSYIDQVMVNAQRQVLIEATVVEVELSNQYQFGVDWSRLADNGTGLSFAQDLLGTNLVDPPRFVLDYAKDSSTFGNITATVRMLEEFGNVKVLSSPKVMAINNQTALLKVVDNLVYFTLEVESTITETGIVDRVITSTPHTVAVGFVMSVTTQISPEQTVTLNMRPTISRVTSFVQDPNPILAENDIESLVPQIQVREMESVLQVNSGQVAVLGGLIQDFVNLSDAGIPGTSQIKGVGDLFNYRDNERKKSELVVFLRPRVITNLDKPLDVYADYLPKPGEFFEPGNASDREAWN
jgi:general secretion pathway protein D